VGGEVLKIELAVLANPKFDGKFWDFRILLMAI
jgi:hypothetical protein